MSREEEDSLHPYRLSYDRGSLLLCGGTADGSRTDGAANREALPDFMRWDERVQAHRCLAICYRTLVRHLVRGDYPYADQARAYPEQAFCWQQASEPYPFQQEALSAWSESKRGQLELPTGAGKTRVGLMAIHAIGRGTLILVPTLELVTQWCQVLSAQLGIQAGVVGGGSYQLWPVTVCTYASAYRHSAHFGDRFALAVFDECHHLAGEGYAHIAEMLIAPYRLGLSATLERADGRHRELERLIGPVLYRKGIGELSGVYLAEYEVQTRYARLSEEERQDYAQARECYLAFVRKAGINLASGRGWQTFVYTAARSGEGRQALSAYHAQRRIAFAAEDKFTLCAEILEQHRSQRILIFTNDNHTAYQLSIRFLLPLITHKTPLTERREIMAHFESGRWPVVVTSKVLNEGVDVPAAGVAVILSGNASVREHVQRLGRILRRDGAQQAVLYELLTADTLEENTSRRRRRHDAYR